MPTAPMPTQTAYAVPTGMLRVASDSRYMLAAMKPRQNRLGPSRVNPAVRGMAAA